MNKTPLSKKVEVLERFVAGVKWIVDSDVFHPDRKIEVLKALCRAYRKMEHELGKEQSCGGSSAS